MLLDLNINLYTKKIESTSTGHSLTMAERSKIEHENSTAIQLCSIKGNNFH